jgi:peptidase E
MMMNKRRKYGIDKLLKQAAEQGIVLSWLSAGAMCWCFSWRSDSRATKGGNGYINVRRLSLLNFYCCVHYKEENYEDIKERLRKNNKVGIILEDCCALQVYWENYRIIASREWSKAYKAYRTHWKYVFEELLQKEEYSSLKNLYNT